MALTDLPFSCPEAALKEQGQMQPSLPLVGEFHQTEGHGSWDIAREAYCPGHGSPGHVSACSPGPPPFEACGVRTQDGHVALEATPANSSPGGSRKGLHMFFMQFLIDFQ